MNAKQFIQEQAEILEAAGNTVTVVETETTISVMSKGSGPLANMIGLSAFKNTRTNRWNLGHATVYRIFSDDISYKTRSRIRIMIDVYGGVWRAREAS